MQLNAILMCNLMGVNYVFEQFFTLSGLWQMSKKKLTSRETYQEAKDKFFLGHLVDYYISPAVEFLPVEPPFDEEDPPVQLSTWSQFLHSGGVPEQLPLKQTPVDNPVLKDPMYFTEHPPFDSQE